MTETDWVTIISVMFNIVLCVLLKKEINRNIDLISDCFIFMDEIGSLSKKVKELEAKLEGVNR